MMKARRTWWGEQMVFRYGKRRMKRHFNGLWLTGHNPLEERLAQLDPVTPLIFFSNHQSWWDGFLEIPLMERYRTDHRLMMEERNLARFPFFRHAGIFGVDLDSPQGRGAGLLYAARHLRKTGGKHRPALFIYPHGRIVPEYEPWPPFMAGVEGVLRLCPVALAVPVVKRFTFSHEPGADVFIDLGPPLEPGQLRERSDLQRALETLKDKQAARLLAGDRQETMRIKL